MIIKKQHPIINNDVEMGSPFFQHLAKSSQNQQIIQYNLKINYKLKMLLEN